MIFYQCHQNKKQNTMEQQSATAIQTLIDSVSVIATNDRFDEFMDADLTEHIRSVFKENAPHAKHVVETALNARTEKRLWHLLALGTHQDSAALTDAGCVTLPVFAVTTKNSKLYSLWVAPGLRGTQLGDVMIEALRQAIGPQFDDSQRHWLKLQRGID
jgi:hypothetical protein